MTEIKGWHVFSGFVLMFGIIIAVNVTMAYNAVTTFPGLEVKNSYIASQEFDQKRRAQEALGWEVSAEIQGNHVIMIITQNGAEITPTITSATLGRATVRDHDQTLTFTPSYDGLTAPITPVEAGKWVLRLTAVAADGTEFEQQLDVRVQS